MNFTEAQYARIVGIEHGDARLRVERFDQLALGERHTVDRSEGFYVRVSYVGDYADIRFGYGR